MKEDGKDKAKKMYYTPELTVYGNVRVITETGAGGNTDNNGKDMTMT